MTLTEQEKLYAEAGRELAPAIARLARAMERDSEKARDLEQDIHCAIWRSLAGFDKRCALRTWVYRVAHNVCAEHRMTAARRPKPVPLEDIEPLPEPSDAERSTGENLAIARAHTLIRLLPTLDAQVMLLWLEGESAKDIADVTGLRADAVATRIHRLKTMIAKDFVQPPLAGEAA